MKKILLTLALILSISFSYAQQGFTVLLPNFEGQTLSQIKKYKDWNILTEVSGDLNHDHIKDVALVLETKDSIYEKRDSSNDELTKGKARVLLVFLSKNGKKIVHTQNN
ncbi:MAG: hypothetical protein AB8B65_18760, partial [Kordia sp.]|uniref:hypothetical protein n=1 Tax=Kordia sp. TaxID=1965332 RepID=UPI00385BCE5C